MLLPLLPLFFDCGLKKGKKKKKKEKKEKGKRKKGKRKRKKEKKEKEKRERKKEKEKKWGMKLLFFEPEQTIGEKDDEGKGVNGCLLLEQPPGSLRISAK